MGLKKIVFILWIVIGIILATGGYHFAEIQTVEVYVGQTISLKPYLISDMKLSEANVKWQSGLSTIASVNGGNVTGVKPGDTYISASLVKSSGIKEVRVNIRVLSAVNKVKLNMDTVNLAGGESFQLVATVESVAGLTKPFIEGVNWKVANESIATVDSTGIIKGLTEGKTEVYAFTKDGGKTARCEINVKYQVKDLKVSEKILKLSVGETYQVLPEILPSDAKIKTVKFLSSNPLVAEVDENGYIKAKFEGKTNIGLTSVDGNRYTSVTVEVKSRVKAIVLNKTYVTLTDALKTEQLQASLIPLEEGKPILEAGINWKSYDNRIVTIDSNGNIVALAPGQTTVYATSRDGGYVASCTVVSTISLNNVTTGASLIQINNPPKSLYVGEGAVLDYNVFPESLASRTVTVKSEPTGKMKVLNENGKITIIPLVSGRHIVKLISGSVEASFEIEAKQSVNRLEILAPSLTKESDQYTIYLGQKFDVIADPQIFGLDAMNFLAKEVKWTYNANSLKVETDKINSYMAKVTLIRPENTYLDVSMLDGSLKQRIFFKYDTMSKDMILPEQASINIDVTYMPVPEFIAKDELKYGYLNVLDQSVLLSVEKFWIPTEFIKGEIEYETKNTLELKARLDQLSEGTEKSATIDLWQKHLLRKNQYELMLKLPQTEYQELINYTGLTDRTLSPLKFFALGDKGVSSAIEGRCLLKVTSKDGGLVKKMVVSVKTQDEDLILMDSQGNVLAVSKAEVSAAEQQKAIEDAARQLKLDELKKKLLSMGIKQLPSDDALQASVSGLNLGILDNSFFINISDNLRREEAAKVLVKAYEKLSLKKIKKITTNYYLDTKSEYANQGYNLGLFSLNKDRKFIPSGTLSNSEVSSLLQKLVAASGKKVSSEILKEIVDWGKMSKGITTKEEFLKWIMKLFL